MAVVIVISPLAPLICRSETYFDCFSLAGRALNSPAAAVTPARLSAWNDSETIVFGVEVASTASDILARTV